MKKLASVFAVITCVFALTACGSAKVNTLSGTPLTDAATEQSIISYGEQLVGSMDSIVRGGTIEEYSDDAVFGPALDSYENSLEDIGEVQGFNNEQAVLDSDGNYLINIGVDGSNHDADVVITVGVKTGTPSNVATNVRYTLGELMEQAGLNTILGMGTTFVILILLSLIISAFALIGKSQANKKKKAAAIQAAEAPAAAPAGWRRRRGRAPPPSQTAQRILSWCSPWILLLHPPMPAGGPAALPSRTNLSDPNARVVTPF